MSELRAPARGSDVVRGRVRGSAPYRLLSRIGMVLALVTGVAVGTASPAYAAPTDLSITAAGGVTLQVGGGSQDVTFTVSNSGFPAKEAKINIDVPLGGDGVSIIQGTDGCTVSGNSLSCTWDFGPNESQEFFVKLKPPSSGGPAAGDSKQGQGQGRVQPGDGDSDTNQGNNAAGFTVTLKGPDAPQTVSGISGKVKDEETDKPVANAKVSVKDSAGKEHTTATNDSGAFKFTSSDEEPIAAGALKFTISKSGYDTKKLTKTGKAGQTLQLETMMTPKVSASASATPEPTESAGGAQPTEGASGEDGGGINWLAWLMYLLAAALVLGGIGAIVWLFRRRDDEEDDEYGEDGPQQRGPTPGAHGVYHGDPYGAQTTVMGAQPTAVMGADQPTSMIGRPGYDQPTSMIDRAGIDTPTSMIDRTGLDSPTMSHPGQVADDGDDVYPAGRTHYAPGSGYGPESGYGRSQQPEYDDYPQRGAGYGGGSAPGYDSRPASGGGYDSRPSSGSGYDSRPASGDGYGSGGYGSGGGRHSAGDADPYGAQGGYGDDRGGYGGQGYAEPRHGDSGYEDPPRRGYGEEPRRGGRHSAADDRRLDWFED